MPKCRTQIPSKGKQGWGLFSGKRSIEPAGTSPKSLLAADGDALSYNDTCTSRMSGFVATSKDPMSSQNFYIEQPSGPAGPPPQFLDQLTTLLSEKDGDRISGLPAQDAVQLAEHLDGVRTPTLA